MTDSLPSNPKVYTGRMFYGDSTYDAEKRNYVLASDYEQIRQDLARTESARVAILAENAHYKRRVAELESTIRGKTFVTPEPPAAQPSNDRSAFDRWLHDVHGLESVWQEERNCYKDFPAHLAYSAWCASRERLPPTATQSDSAALLDTFETAVIAHARSFRQSLSIKRSEALAIDDHFAGRPVLRPDLVSKNEPAVTDNRCIAQCSNPEYAPGAGICSTHRDAIEAAVERGEPPQAINVEPADRDLIDIPDYLRNQDNLRAERAAGKKSAQCTCSKGDLVGGWDHAIGCLLRSEPADHRHPDGRRKGATPLTSTNLAARIAGEPHETSGGAQ